ncbi:hypothetical protein C8D77_11180 [Mesorhizobium loti]|uniref:Uncharacterized protein n=1 Tax=Rhizobium loti TaxID=381 RepID=A0A8E3B2Q6_RHILI|nr:hypothetical protein [Mesorhizobium loti]PWJ88358.1 hypothetical protein C8D77_11180 [Mesorhizobium loti]
MNTLSRKRQIEVLEAAWNSLELTPIPLEKAFAAIAEQSRRAQTGALISKH